jgi:hypothetical protein
MSLNESTIEAAALEWFGELCYAIAHDSKRSRTRVALRGTLPPKRLSWELSVAEFASIV